MSLINWIFDIYQHSKIEDTRQENAEIRRELAAVQRSGAGGVDSPALQRALEELALATKTLQRMMVEKGVCSHEDFESRLRQIDREDGREDGRTPLR